MAKIRVLNERLINKIAAGEVVERPASALKEMLENSLDAGARELRIELEAGGKQLIRIVDDGEGMDPDDILLALERHATSKIREFEDLEAVGTLGFRGEAIPSIAAVSRMTLRSRRAELPEGREVVIEGGVIRAVNPVAMAPGTAIEVRSLFFNVPARRKFLRATATEFAQCQNVISHYAMAFPEIALRVRHNGQELIVAPPAESTRDRIAMLLGTNILQRLLPFEGREGEYGVMGFVGDPSFTRPDTAMLHFFVNRRVVRDKVLIHAIRAAFDDLLPKGRTPVAFIFLDMPAPDVDVNVHPSKTEVRFKFSDLVHELVVRTIRATLTGHKPLATLSLDDQHRPRRWQQHRGAAVDAAEQTREKEPATEHPRTARFEYLLKPSAMPMPTPDRSKPTGDRSVPSLPPTDTVDLFAVPGAEERYAAERVAAAAIDPLTVVPLGQVKNSYIVATYGGGLLLIDQHAAHERVLFEQLQRAARGRPFSQMLLHPVIVDLPPAQARLSEAHAAELAALGFEVEPFGPGSVALRSLPADLEPERAEEIFVHMAIDLERVGAVATRERMVREMVVSASCHGAIKVNTPLDTEKMRWLIERLFACDMPMRCPHGRPVVLTLSEPELRQRFGRS